MSIVEIIRRNFLVVLLLVALSLLVACGGTPTPPPTPTPEPLAEELIFYNWEGDAVQPVFDAFEEEYGVKVTYVPYESQEEALENIRAGEQYDLVVLDNNFIPGAIEDGLLAEIDLADIPNFKNIWANFRDLSYDPGNQYSVPFTWGTTALLVHDDLADEVTAWADLWKLDDENKIAMREAHRDILGLTLKSLDYSSNSTDPAELEEALEKLLEIKENIVFVGVDAESALPVLSAGDASVLVGWAEDAQYAQEEGEPFGYVLPEDGVMLWGDNFVIPANSPHKGTAELFLNYLLRPEISAQMVNETYYATTNEAALPFVEEEIRNDITIFPPNESLQNAEVILPLNPEATELYNEIWNQFKETE